MAATSQQSSQELISDWFQKAAEMTEAAMMATARMQLATLDRFMDSMTAGWSMLESAPIEPQQWFGGAGGEQRQGAQAQQKAGQRKQAKGRSRSHSKSRSKSRGRK